MNKILNFVLIIIFLSYSVQSSIAESFSSNISDYERNYIERNFNTTYLNNPALFEYLESTVYQSLIENLSDDYIVEEVNTVYLSKEYIANLTFNSQENIYFGYTLSELDAHFKGQKYIFTLGENGQTVVKPFEKYDDTFDKIIKNVAIGTGVILVCVTVSVVTGGAGLPAVSMIFAASAKTATIMALSGAASGAVISGAIEGVVTHDFDKAMKAAALGASEGYKWGAITGAVAGGLKEGIALKNATSSGLTMNEAALIQKESKYPIDVIKGFKNMEQYKICKNAGLKPFTVNGKTALIRGDIDLKFVDEFGRTNLQRMQNGLAPIDSATGKAFELHHIGQKMDSTLAILTKAEHMQGGNNTIWHTFGSSSEIDRTIFDSQRKEFWKAMAEILPGGKI